MCSALKHKPCIIINIILNFALFLPGFSQSTKEAKNFRITFTDSLQTKEKESFAYNSIHLENTTKQKKVFQVLLSVPTGWKSVSAQKVSMELDPGERKAILVSLLRLGNATAIWQKTPVTIEDSLNSEPPQVFNFYVRPTPIAYFVAEAKDKNILLRSTDKSFQAILKLANRGNTIETYFINWKNSFFNLDKNQSITLKPGQDTILSLEKNITRNHFSNLALEKLIVRISDSKTFSSTFFYLSKISSSAALHNSSYAQLPLQLELGYMNFDQNSSFFAALRGTVKVGKGHLSFSYRTKDYGIANSITRNSVRASYTSDRWDINAGEAIADNTLFFTYGQGIAIKRKFKDSSALTVGAIWPYKNYFFGNTLYWSTLEYPFKKMYLSSSLYANLDPDTYLNSYVFKQTASIFNKPEIKFDVNAEAGINKVTTPGVYSYKPGLGFGWGYNFAASVKGFSFSSNMQFNNKDFPGMMTGLKNISNSVGWGHKIFNINAYYFSNVSASNPLRDTLYNSDIFTYNYTRYGIRTGILTFKQSFTIGAGKMKQNSGGNFFGAKDEYNFGELNYSFKTRHGFSWTLYSTVGYKNVQLTNSEVKNWLYNVNTNIRFKTVGVNGVIVRYPVTAITDTGKSIYNETYNVGPYIGLRLFKYLNINLQYSFSKTSIDNSSNTFLTGNINYDNRKKGLAAAIYGSIPVNNTGPSFYNISGHNLTVSVRKDFNTPIPGMKKYTTLRLRPFCDENNNNTKDANEKVLGGQLVNIDNIPFITDKDGLIIYKHIEKKLYQLNFSNFQNLKGWVPANGNVQSVYAADKEIVNIPFKRSKTITGSIKVILDERYHTIFSAEGLKVTVTDSTGKVFSTLANGKGEFFFNVPAGIFQVSLNPEAFNDNIKPVQLSYKADLLTKQDAYVEFTIKQKNREIRFLNNNSQ